MICEKCGKKNSETAKFCIECGTPLKAKEEPKEKIKEEPKEDILKEEAKITEKELADNTEKKIEPIKETAEPKTDKPKEEIKEEPKEDILKEEAKMTEEQLPPNVEAILNEKTGADKPPMDPKKKKTLFIGIGIAAALLVLILIISGLGKDKRPIEEVFGGCVTSYTNYKAENPPKKPGDKLAVYDVKSKKWLEEYLSKNNSAKVAGDVGAIVIINETTNYVGRYLLTSGISVGSAYRWNVSVRIIDPYNGTIIAKNTFTGGPPPQRSSGNAYGSKPSKDTIEAWILKNWPAKTDL